MKVTAIKTPVVAVGDDWQEVLKTSLPSSLPEKSVIAITSKILGLAQKRVVAAQKGQETAQKHQLAQQEADWYLDQHLSRYGIMITIKNDTLISSAGIDASNTGGWLVLWPEDVQKLTNQIWRWLRTTYQLRQVGVIITDSHCFPLRWGVIGTSLAYCGFRGLNSKIGQKDLFGYQFAVTRVNVAEALAATAVFEMGETNEQTPVALITEIRDITFQARVPNQTELQGMKIDRRDDVFAPILTAAPWKKGKQH